ncbi:MAG: host specificity protein [Planctomycetales bacterium]|nr:host specificity protein [Planctomycetales bacterium]
MATKSIKQILADGELVRLFSIGRVVSPVLFDMFSFAGGFDAVWLDQEHGGLTYEQVCWATTAARAGGFDSFVRMAVTDYSAVTQNLEAGAGGVMAARVESADHAELFVQWTKFTPRGNRGMNTSGRDSRYTFKSQNDFAVDSNRDHFVAIQIETLGALDDAEAIAAIDGVDLLFVGPSDLSQALGHLGQLDHADTWAGIDRVAAACARHGKHWGIVPAGPEYAAKAIDKGCRMVSFGGDTVVLRRGLEAIKESFAQWVG